MKNQNEIINDLKVLVNILNDGKEGYKDAVEHVKSKDLKETFLAFSAERAIYAEELKAHILQHGGSSDNDEGGVLGALHRSWLAIKEAFSSNEDGAILSAIETGEEAALEKYDTILKDYEGHADHYALLKKQRDGIKGHLNKIKSLELAHQD
ncbi:PA2169 family four-helix-bundle protein [Pedobacter sp. SD-b]|uniref:PA2169 family four-helix-bundle protein n=1 Tax=Pedobacter segetis TaxID=2793069 RepID=A0ABS1BKU8_9SPHI|nr:PA2169 family four-helix-bundle protein [Pedobacter segetis]MBK0382946.1 PA2169 family four-helix-bundle protein [Pedobacter segetis]